MGASNSKGIVATNGDVLDSIDSTRHARSKSSGRKSFSARRKRKSKVVYSAPSNSDADGLFAMLDDDVLLNILSFVSVPPTFKDDGNDEERSRLWQSYNDAIRKESAAVLKKKKSSKSSPAPPVSGKMIVRRPPHHHIFDGADNGDNTYKALNSINGPQYDCSFKKKKTAAPPPDGLVSSDQKFGTLTHVLPLVNKRFHRLCFEHGALWIQALIGLVETDDLSARSGRIWRNALLKLFLDHNPMAGSTDEVQWLEEYSGLSSEDLVDMAYQSYLANAAAFYPESPARCMFLDVTFRYCPLELPMLFLPFRNMSLERTQEISLHQSSHRLLVEDILEGRAPREAMDGLMDAPRPRILVAYQERPSIRTHVGAVVEVTQCCLQNKGSVKLTFLPLAYVLLDGCVPYVDPEAGAIWHGTTSLRVHGRREMPVLVHNNTGYEERGEKWMLGQKVQKKVRMTPEQLESFEEALEEHKRNKEKGEDTLMRFACLPTGNLKAGDIAFVVDLIDYRIERPELDVYLQMIRGDWVLIDRMPPHRNEGSRRVFANAVVQVPSTTQ